MYLINGCWGSSGINLVWILVVAHLRKGISDNWGRKDWSRICSVLIFINIMITKAPNGLAGLQSKPWVSSCTKLLLTEIWIWKLSWQLWTLLNSGENTVGPEKNSGLFGICTHGFIGHGSLVMGSKSKQAWIFFSLYFHYYLFLIISIHNCKDCFHICFFNHSLHIWFSNIYSRLLAEIHSKLLEFDLNLK